MNTISEHDIAVIGMSGRFPDAPDIKKYWENLVNGYNSIKQSNKEELEGSGIGAEVYQHPQFVNASSKLKGGAYFDADFFGISGREATIMDPQIRLLLETSWHALEDAGYAQDHLDCAVANFCGMSFNTYLVEVLQSQSITDDFDPLLYRILNDKDFLATWISYKLNLTGPAMSVQTACSTSLLAIHLACQSLLNYECSMALAGGVAFDAGKSVGYIHVAESIYSKDGLCRPFDEKASGTVGGDGVGVVVLKRAIEAIEDKDHIYGIVKGTAANNDGSHKQAYTAPSFNQQRDVILEAASVSEIDLTTIGMIEAHGTGTKIGDPIEVAAISEAFKKYTNDTNYCALGSVKSNIGHLDAAAGIASFIKAILCVKNGALVPSLHFSKPNPVLNIESTPFYVSQNHQPWPDRFEVRRAGISSLGVGGTNVHIIVEEPPKIDAQSNVKRPFVVTVSAKNADSLKKQKENLATFIQSSPDLLLQDIEFTTLYGRKVMPFRFSAVYRDKVELVKQLQNIQTDQSWEEEGTNLKTVWMFPGQGSQYSNMAADLYQSNEAFRKDMDHCFELVKSNFEIDYKEIIFSDNSDRLDKTEHTQISLFIVEYCLAQMLLRSGLKPDILIGHSLGEYVASCIAGCLSLEDAITLVMHRGRLMGSMPSGGMLLVQLTEEELKGLLIEGISICVINTQKNIVVGGTLEQVEQQSRLFDINQIKYRKLKVSHAYHTPAMQGAADQFEEILREVKFNDFDTKIVSTYTGKFVEPASLCTTQYWTDQIMQPVKFSNAIEEIADYLQQPIFIEVGPGTGLSSFVKSTLGRSTATVNLLPRSASKEKSIDVFYKSLAKLAVNGVEFNLPEKHDGKRVSLPGYVFLKQHFWKPELALRFGSFNEIGQSFHYNQEAYKGKRIKNSFEIQIDAIDKIPDHFLAELDLLNQKYLNEIKKMLNGKDQIVNNQIAAYFDRLPKLKEENNGTFLLKSTHQQKRTNGNFVKPRSGIEEKIAVFWGEILGYDPVSINDDYLEVGGNSLLATHLINKISQDIQIELTIADILTNATVKDLSLLVEEKLSQQNKAEQTNELII